MPLLVKFIEYEYCVKLVGVNINLTVNLKETCLRYGSKGLCAR